MAAPIKRPGQGGGFLNNVAGVITEIRFEAGTKGETKAGNAFTAYSAKLTITPEGGDPVTQYAPAGFLYGDNAISKNGRTIEGSDPYFLDGASAFGQLVVSLLENENNKLPEDLVGDCRNYDAVEGVRVMFARVKDEAETKRRGKRKDPKTGREYDRDVLLVTDVLGVPAAKGAAKKGGAKAAATADVSNDTADAAMKSVLATAKDQTIERGKKLETALLRFTVAQKMDTPTRNAFTKFVTGDDYLANAQERGILVADETSVTLL